MHDIPTLNLGLTFSDLFQLDGLQRLDAEFLRRLQALDADLPVRLLHYRHTENAFTPLQTSELLLACAPVLEGVIAELFAIETELEQLQARTLSHDPILQFKKLFVQRRARRRLIKNDVTQSFAELDAWLDQSIQAAGLDSADRELAIARFGQTLLADEAAHSDAIEQLTRWAILCLSDPLGQAAVRGWTSFKLPQGMVPAHLVPVEASGSASSGMIEAVAQNLRRRDGFKLTDQRMSARAVQGEVHYCIYCHDHDGDFCSKGFPEKKGEPALGFKINSLGVTLTGCPLEEKISEMHILKRDGHGIAALAMAMVDNPMIPATGTAFATIV